MLKNSKKSRPGKRLAFLPGIKKIHVFYLTMILIGGIVILSAFRSPGKEEQQGEYITMRIYENFTVTSSRIIIVYADDKSEIIGLSPFKYNDDYLVKNNQVITRTLNKLRKEGYRIVISSASGKVSSSRDMMITTYILER
jgi:hypothetical protein